MARIGTKSPWRLRARQIIKDVLAGLSKGTSLKDQRKACNERYPFGEKAHEPYKAWLKEMRLAIGTVQAKRVTLPSVVNITPEAIECDWCGGGKLMGLQAPRDKERFERRCLMCAATRDRWEADEVTNWDEWRRWLMVLDADPSDTAARLVFADWLEIEQDWPGQACIERARARESG